MGESAFDDGGIKAQTEILRMLAETRKFMAEQAKLAAEAEKFRRERFLAPILAAGALGGAIAAILAIMTRALGLL